MDVCLVNMPFDSINIPSLGLGLLVSEARRAGLSARVCYASMEFLSGFGVERTKKLTYNASSIMQVLEVIFQPYAGYESWADNDEIFAFLNTQQMPSKMRENLMSLIIQAQEYADGFLDRICDRILADNPRIVGCTCMLIQTNAGLALLKRIRERRPDVITVLGGAACSPYAGQALVDNMAQVDYVFCGESDDIFAKACKLMLAGDRAALARDYPSVLQKGGVPNGHVMRNLDDCVYPDFDDYFAEIERQGLAGRIHVVLPVEASRGCWWGRCRFCALMQDGQMRYRFKYSARVTEELDYLSARYGVKEFFFADCIMAPEHIKKLPDMLESKGYMMHNEIRSDMSAHELGELRRAGFFGLMPGVEAIDDAVLEHIDKGVSAIRNVEFLRNCALASIDPLWNLMYGFPGENAEWYVRTCRLIPKLTHLKWPNVDAFRYQRNSIFTRDEEKYGVKTQIHPMYKVFFGRDERFHQAFAEYYIDPERRMPYENLLVKTVMSWIIGHMSGAKLNYRDTDAGMYITDTRACAYEKEYALTLVETRVCRACQSVTQISALPHEWRGAVDSLEEKNLLLHIGDELLFLALPEGVSAQDAKRDFMIFQID